MTREEAKEILTHNWTRVDNPNYSESELDEAFFMAIEALSADTVSREEYEEVKAYMDTLVDAFIEDGEEIAESVKVVRCKDCIHQEFYINDAESFCCHMTGIVNMHMEDGDGEFFCKYGERREE